MMHDTERLKTKVEMSLDSRQIFFLFFGGAVVACLVFVLGVMVGKRLEARASIVAQAEAAAAKDPLAALDALGADEDTDELAFAAALAGDASHRKPLGAAELAPPAVVPPPAAKAPAKAAPKAEQKPAADATDRQGGARFTLQLSSFQDRAEAQALVDKIGPSGMSATVVEKQLPEKGTVYRVRVGEFGSHGEAVAAKGEFEKKHHVIAYVTRL